jgi:hypothetical protein
MAHENLHAFLVALSTHKQLRDTLKAGGPGAEKLMKEAGLTAKERALVKGGDKAKIKKYLGDSYAAAAKIDVI